MIVSFSAVPNWALLSNGPATRTIDVGLATAEADAMPDTTASCHSSRAIAVATIR